MKKLNKIAYLLVLIGGLNLGLVGLANYDLISRLFGWIPYFVMIIYDLMGLSALWLIYHRPKRM